MTMHNDTQHGKTHHYTKDCTLETIRNVLLSVTIYPIMPSAIILTVVAPKRGPIRTPKSTTILILTLLIKKLVFKDLEKSFLATIRLVSVVTLQNEDIIF